MCKSPTRVPSLIAPFCVTIIDLNVLTGMPDFSGSDAVRAWWAQRDAARAARCQRAMGREYFMTLRERIARKERRHEERLHNR